ncbi:MAG: HAD hydrolase-like protein [Acidobacteriota bacterium]|nr:HAD hydrolase-like protein [Acidobacteriota bacterium]
MKLVLFDIDGTLLDGGGQTRELLAVAAETACGAAGTLRSDGFAGRTDDQIIFHALQAGGLPEPRIAAVLPQIKTHYLELLGERLDRARMELLPGVEATLERLEATDDVEVGLLTGNWEGGARLKLGRVEIESYFAFGAFGDDCKDRLELPPVALREASRHVGHEFAFDDVLIVGDTENDARCARGHGIAMLAVATGAVSPAALARAGADWVVEDLLQVDVVAVLGRLSDAGSAAPRVDARNGLSRFPTDHSG